MPSFKLKALFYVIFILSIILGFSLRIDDLGSRPMHTDEAIQAWRLGSMIEGEGFNYRPDDGHGPVLLFLSMPAVWIKSINNYQELNEVILRSVTAIVGTLLILVMLLFKRLISIQGIAISSALVALSPMHVYYSRYYIMETPMLLFLALFLFCSWKYFQQQKYYWMIGAGFACGVMHATKETFVISIASIVIAATIIFLIEELRKNKQARLSPKKLGLNFCFGLIIMIFSSAALFTVFFNNIDAIKDSYTSYSNYLSRAEGSGHEKTLLVLHKSNFMERNGTLYLERISYYYTCSGGYIFLFFSKEENHQRNYLFKSSFSVHNHQPVNLLFNTIQNPLVYFAFSSGRNNPCRFWFFLTLSIRRKNGKNPYSLSIDSNNFIHWNMY